MKEQISIQKPLKSDWEDMSNEYGWHENEFALNTPVGRYVVGKRKRRDGEVRWWFTDNEYYKYAVHGREYESKGKAMKAAWNHYKGILENHTFK